MKDNAKTSQQKGRRIPIQLQDQKDKEIEKLRNIVKRRPYRKGRLNSR